MYCPAAGIYWKRGRRGNPTAGILLKEIVAFQISGFHFLMECLHVSAKPSYLAEEGLPLRPQTEMLGEHCIPENVQHR
jgi:hypothetical protein